MLDARWLKPEEAARHIGERTVALAKLVKDGRIPPPSYTLGPRKPRYDREALDAAMQGAAASNDIDQVAHAIAQKILRESRRGDGRKHSGAKP